MKTTKTILKIISATDKNSKQIFIRLSENILVPISIGNAIDIAMGDMVESVITRAGGYTSGIGDVIIGLR